MLLGTVNLSQLKSCELSAFGSVCSTSAVWCWRHSQAGAGATRVPEGQVTSKVHWYGVVRQEAEPSQTVYMSKEEDFQVCHAHWTCRCCQSARLPISLQATSQQSFASQPGIAPSNNMIACSHPRKPATGRAHGNMVSFVSRRQRGACRRSKRTEHVASLNPAIHYLSHSVHLCGQHPILPLDRPLCSNRYDKIDAPLVRPPLAAVRYHKII